MALEFLTFMMPLYQTKSEESWFSQFHVPTLVIVYNCRDKCFSSAVRVELAKTNKLTMIR